MARFTTTVQSAAALPVTTPSGSTAGQLFANLAASAGSGFKLRRITIGTIAGSGAPTSQQVAIALVRTTARGTPTTTYTPSPLDPNGSASAISGLDTAWSAVPTVASWGAPYFWQIPFNDQSTGDLPWELLEELIAPKGAGNGLAFINIGNALPAGTSYLMSLEHEE